MADHECIQLHAGPGRMDFMLAMFEPVIETNHGTILRSVTLRLPPNMLEQSKIEFFVEGSERDLPLYDPDGRNVFRLKGYVVLEDDSKRNARMLFNVKTRQGEVMIDKLHY